MKKNKTRKSIAPEYDFSGAERGRYKDKVRQGPAKVKITMFVDSDVLNWFKEQARKPGSLTYQQRMRISLRESMENSERMQRRDGGSLLSDQDFIRQVAEQVHNMPKVS